MASRKPDLSITALYTSATWSWGRLSQADLYQTREARIVFAVTNFVLLITRLFMWSLRSLKHSLLHRHTMIDHVLEDDSPPQVLELASGLSRRGAHFTEDASLQYTEIDLPAVIDTKKMLLDRTSAGQEVAQRENFKLVSGDVSSLELAPLRDPTQPLFIIAEGLCMYLKPHEQRALWKRLADLLTQGKGGTFVFDLVPWVEQPKPGPIGRALEWLMKRFTGGKAFERDLRTRDDIVADLESAGFTQVHPLEPADISEAWNLPFPRHRTQQVLYVCRLDLTATRVQSTIQ